MPSSPETSTYWKASGKRGAVVAVGREAADAGMEILKAGGNAIDGAVAALLALSVIDSKYYCFGSEVAILVYDAKRQVVEVLSGQGTAPKLATLEYFEKRGGIPSAGIETATVPADLDAYLTALERYGTKTFAQVVSPTLRFLERRGDAWHTDRSRTFRRLIEAEKASQGNRHRGLQLVADYFYRGPIAREVAEWCADNGGLIRYEDMATHVTHVEKPVHVEYRGYTVYKCGPWTQGPWLLQALNLLEGFDLSSMGHNTPDTIHITLEAMKLALADRDTYYADPRCVKVPIQELLSKKYAELRRPLIDRDRASQVQRPGDPIRGRALLNKWPQRSGRGGPSADTSTCIVADAEDNIVAATPSGVSGILVGQTGIFLGTRLSSFNTWENHPNCLAAKKRPRITLTPTLVLRSNKPVLAVSVAGGDFQDQVTLQMLVDSIDFRRDPEEAVTALRFGTDHLVGSFGQAPPKLGSSMMYAETGERAIRELEMRGHQVQIVSDALWAPAILSVDPASGDIRAAGDPRTGRNAEAY